MKEFSIGHRVRFIDGYENYPTASVRPGAKGTIVEVTSAYLFVEMDYKFDGYSEEIWDVNGWPKLGIQVMTEFMTEENPVLEILTLQERKEDAVERGILAFWEVVAKSFPEATSDDSGLGGGGVMEDGAIEEVSIWVNANVMCVNCEEAPREENKEGRCAKCFFVGCSSCGEHPAVECDARGYCKFCAEVEDEAARSFPRSFPELHNMVDDYLAARDGEDIPVITAESAACPKQLYFPETRAEDFKADQQCGWCGENIRHSCIDKAVSLAKQRKGI